MEKLELKITFKPNKSQYYKSAVKLAEKIGCKKKNDRTVCTVDGLHLEKNMHEIYGLCGIVGRWKESRLYIDGDEVSFRQLRHELTGLDCYYYYLKTVIQPLYCRQHKDYLGWGCRQLTEIKRHYGHSILNPSEPFWFELGYFVDDESWEINKADIKRFLKREAELKRLNLCPLFNLDKIFAEVDKLPDYIDLPKSEWHIVYDTDAGGERQAVKIWPVEERY